MDETVGGLRDVRTLSLEAKRKKKKEAMHALRGKKTGGQKTKTILHAEAILVAL